MILTYKVKHNYDFSKELEKVRTIAEIAVESHPQLLTTKHVKHIGLKSVIANQVLRKYGRNKTIKSVRRVKLTLPNQGIKLNQTEKKIRITSLKVEFEYRFPNNFEKVNQIEIDNEYFYVSVTVIEKEQFIPEGFIGVDLNTTEHIAVAANPQTGKILKLGKKADHIHKKYREIRRELREQSYKKYLRGNVLRNLQMNWIQLERIPLCKGTSLNENRLKDLEEKIECKIVYCEETPEKLFIVLEEENQINNKKIIEIEELLTKKVHTINDGMEKGLVVSLLDQNHHFLGLGVISKIDYKNKKLKLFTPCRKKISIVQFGQIKSNRDGKEL